MKKRLHPLLIMLFLMGIATSLPSRNAEPISPACTLSDPEAIHIYAGPANEVITWYVEENAISDAFGVMIIEMKGASKEKFFSRLEDLEGKEAFSKFILSPQDNLVEISMGDKDSQLVVAELIAQLRN